MVRDFLDRLFPDTDLLSDLNPFSSINSESTTETDSENQDANAAVVDDEYIIKIDRITGEEPYNVDQTDKVVTVDPTRGDWDNSKNELREYWRGKKKRAFTESAFGLYLSIQASKGDVDEVMNFFDPILSASQSSMLEEAYHLSKYFDNFNVDNQEEYGRRGKLSDKYKSSAMNVPSLCSAGYFEEHGLFRSVYNQLSESDAQDDDFQDLFDTLIRHRPFVQFVTAGTDFGVGELRYMISQKSNHLNDLPVEIDYLHVRGIGHGPQKIIMELKDELAENGVKQMVDVIPKENGPNELVLAIDNSSL